MTPRLTHRCRLAAALVPLVASMSGATVLSAQGTYHVSKRLKIGGEGGWDYLVADAAAHRLFVSRGTHVTVIDTDRDSVAGDIPNTAGVHGVALAPELGKGFTSNGRDSSVTVFDYRTLATTARIRITGANPDAIVYEPVTRRVFTFNGRSHDATAIDAATNVVLGTIALSGKPEAATVDGAGTVYVNIEEPQGKVSVIDARTLAVKATWAVAGCEEPSGQAIDRGHALLFLACANRVMAVVSYRDGSEVARVPIGAGTDGAAFDAVRGMAFSTNGRDGTVTVVRQESPAAFSVVANVPTQLGARTIALDERTHRVYTVSADFEPPAPNLATGQPRMRRAMVPGSFTVLVLEP